MNNEAMLALAPLAGLGFAVVIFILSMRIFRQEGKAITAGIAAGLAAVALCLANLSASLAESVIAVISYGAMAFCFWTSVNFSCVSLRMRVLRELLRAPGRTLTLPQLMSLYSPEEMLSRRLARLEKYGHLESADGRFRVKKRYLLTIAACIERIRRLIIPTAYRHDQI